MNQPQPATTVDALPSLATSQPVLTVLLNSLDGMVYRLRVDPDWTIEHASDGCERLLGLPSGELVGHGRIAYDRLIHLDDRQRVRAELYRVLMIRETPKISDSPAATRNKSEPLDRPATNCRASTTGLPIQSYDSEKSIRAP